VRARTDRHSARALGAQHVHSECDCCAAKVWSIHGEENDVRDNRSRSDNNGEGKCAREAVVQGVQRIKNPGGVYVEALRPSRVPNHVCLVGV